MLIGLLACASTPIQPAADVASEVVAVEAPAPTAPVEVAQPRRPTPRSNATIATVCTPGAVGTRGAGRPRGREHGIWRRAGSGKTG